MLFKQEKFTEWQPLNDHPLRPENRVAKIWAVKDGIITLSSFARSSTAQHRYGVFDKSHPIYG